MSTSATLPLLVIFGLDGTLWPHNVDMDVIPPLRKDRFGEIVDTNLRFITYYEDVPKIFERLKTEGVKIGVTSYNLDSTTTERMVKIFEWEQFITFLHTRPRNKVKQILRMREISGINFSDMLFFDDRQENIEKISALGVLSVLVEEGVNLEKFENGLRRFRMQKMRRKEEKGEDTAAYDVKQHLHAGTSEATNHVQA